MVKSQTSFFTVQHPEYPLADKYERVHFVAHCRFGFVDKAALEQEVRARVYELEEQVGYRCFFVKLETRGLEPLWLDVDFIWDLPATSPVATVVIAAVIIILGALGIIALLYMWWTVYVQEVMVFYCDQCEDEEGNFRWFQGRADYDAHLQLEHPEKWSYIDEQRDEAYWWLDLIKALPMLIGGLLAITLVSYLPKPRRREEE